MTIVKKAKYTVEHKGMYIIQHIEHCDTICFKTALYL